MTVRAVILSTVLMLAAMTAHAQSAPEAGARPQYSGFLGDYSQLKPAEDREGVMVYVDRSKSIAPFRKIMFHPVEVYVSPGAEYKGIRPDVLQRMSDQLLTSFRKSLTPGYEIVTAPGPDVLEVRSAITGVQPVRTDLTPLDFLPIKAVFNVGRAAAGQSPQVVELSAEMELLAPGKKRVAAAVATRKGDKTLHQGDQITWQHMQAISDYWAKNFRERLDQLRAGSGR